MKNTVSSRWSLASKALRVLAFSVSAMVLPAHALTVSGVKFQPETSFKGSTVQLNGAGVRQLANRPLYAAGLYLEQKASTPEAVLQTAGAKQIRVVMLRTIPSAEFGDLLSKGLLGNSSEDTLANLIPEIMDLSTLIAQHGKLQRGDSFVIDWSAAEGTTIRVSQRTSKKPAMEVFVKRDLIDALLRIWLGEKPADAALKAALLGKPA
jgi:hypothetical protein